MSSLVTLVGAMVAAKMIDMGAMQHNSIGYAVLAILFLSSFLGAMIAAEKTKRQLIMVCALSGTAYFLILLGVTALFFDGQYEAVGVTALVVLGGSVLAAMNAVRPKRGGGRRKIEKLNG